MIFKNIFIILISWLWFYKYDLQMYILFLTADYKNPLKANKSFSFKTTIMDAQFCPARMHDKILLIVLSLLIFTKNCC